MMELIVFGLYGFALGVLASPLIRFSLKRVVRPIRCRLGLCEGRIVDSDYGVAWHCATCGKVSGFMSNKRIKETIGR